MSDADHGVTGELVEAFIRLARGDFTVRLPRNFQRDQVLWFRFAESRFDSFMSTRKL